MTLPTITLNGTKKKVLIDDLCAAKHALYLAGIALEKAMPHPRDYPDNGTGSYVPWTKARDEHVALRKKLCEVFDAVDARIDAIDEIPE